MMLLFAAPVRIATPAIIKPNIPIDGPMTVKEKFLANVIKFILSIAANLVIKIVKMTEIKAAKIPSKR